MLVNSCRLAVAAAFIIFLPTSGAFAQDESLKPGEPGYELMTRSQSPESRVGVYRIRESKDVTPRAEAKPVKTLAERVFKRDFRYGDWVAAQLFLVVCGLIASLIALAIAPRTTTLAVAAIDAEPARSAVVGFLGLAALGVVNAINGALFGTVIWIPFGTLVALASTITFLFSGLLGVAYFGGVLQKRRRPGVRGFLGRSAVGLIAIALFNCIPGVNAASLFLQLVAFVLGLGGLVITGFGRGPDWLSQRLADAGREWRD